MDFARKVYKLVSGIPRGRVAAYGQIAAICGSPRAARQGGWGLGKVDSDSQVPWWRVVNAKGMISIENLAVPKAEQARRLQEEGIAVELRDGNYWVDLKKYLWDGRD